MPVLKQADSSYVPRLFLVIYMFLTALTSRAVQKVMLLVLLFSDIGCGPVLTVVLVFVVLHRDFCLD